MDDEINRAIANTLFDALTNEAPADIRLVQPYEQSLRETALAFALVRLNPDLSYDDRRRILQQSVTDARLFLHECGIRPPEKT